MQISQHVDNGNNYEGQTNTWYIFEGVTGSIASVLLPSLIECQIARARNVTVFSLNVQVPTSIYFTLNSIYK